MTRGLFIVIVIVVILGNWCGDKGAEEDADYSDGPDALSDYYDRY